MFNVFQLISGRLNSPASQKIEFLCWDLTLVISLHNFSQSSKEESGALYAQHTRIGFFPGWLILTKMDSDSLLFKMSVLLRDFLIQRKTPPPALSVLSCL